MKKILVFYLALCTSGMLSAQLSSVYDEDMNAIHLSAGLEKGKEVDGFSCELGLSLKSHFEIEGSYIKTNFNTQDQYTYDGYINGVSGMLTWWFLSNQMDNKTSYSLGLKGGLESNDYRNYRYWKDEATFIEYDGYSVGKLGLTFAMNHWVDNQLIVMPTASAFYERGNSTTTNIFINSHDYCKGMTGKIGAYLMRKTNYSDVLYLYPSVLFNYHERKAPVMLNLTVGMMVGY